MSGASEQTTIIPLSAGATARRDVVRGQVVIDVGDETIAFQLTIPSGSCSTTEMLPIMQGFGDVFADRGIAQVVRGGETLSCRAGCGACCRQIVPIAHAEAVALAALVEAMPEPRRSTIVARFDAALATIEAAGMIDQVSAGGPATTRDRGLAYFRLGIACPFLEDEACSIYADRPLACREYLVTSPAENCADPTPDGITMVPIAARPSRALLAIDPASGWLALVLALRRAEHTPVRQPDRTGPEIIGSFVGALGH